MQQLGQAITEFTWTEVETTILSFKTFVSNLKAGILLTALLGRAFPSNGLLGNKQYFSFLAGGRCSPDQPNFGWGGKAPSGPPLKRSFVTFDRGGQTGPPRSNDFFFGAADDTRAADDRPQTIENDLKTI